MIPKFNYPSPANVKIYIGDIHIDDAFRVDWQAQNPKTPMYSWADSQYRAVAQGREIVSGRLLINYRFPGYLISAIKGSITGPGARTLRPGRSMMYHTNDGIGSGVFRQHVTQKVLEMSEGTADDRIKALMSANARDDEGFDLSEYKAALKAINTPNPWRGGRENAGGGGSAGWYKGISKESSYQAGVQVPFDIKIIYGDAEGYHTSKTLVDCHVTGESQVISGSATGGGDMSSSGSPIYEVYSFFCRSVKEGFSNPPLKVAEE